MHGNHKLTLFQHVINALFIRYTVYVPNYIQLACTFLKHLNTQQFDSYMVAIIYSAIVLLQLLTLISVGAQGDQGSAMTDTPMIDRQPTVPATGPPPDQVNTPAQGML